MTNLSRQIVFEGGKREEGRGRFYGEERVSFSKKYGRLFVALREVIGDFYSVIQSIFYGTFLRCPTSYH